MVNPSARSNPYGIEDGAGGFIEENTGHSCGDGIAGGRYGDELTHSSATDIIVAIDAGGDGSSVTDIIVATDAGGDRCPIVS